MPFTGNGSLSFQASLRIFSTESSPHECVTSNLPDTFNSRINGAITLETFVMAPADIGEFESSQLLDKLSNYGRLTVDSSKESQ